MDERLDGQLAIIATMLVVVLLFGQIVLMAMHVWAPITHTADRLIVDEDAPIGDEPVAEGPEGTYEAPRGPWYGVGIALSVTAGMLGLFAAWRIRDGSTERNRWISVLVLAALVVVWGIFTLRLIARSPQMFGRL
ncbi:MAG: hypothetical protein GX131_11115 [candidate division WS1 bacterium]|jgi:hypothetical protein|nr:hypothetical protein [candidate division WS1 bacterium]